MIHQRHSNNKIIGSLTIIELMNCSRILPVGVNYKNALQTDSKALGVEWNHHYLITTLTQSVVLY